MSEEKPKDIVASVLARLRNNAKVSGATFQQVLQQYAMERFLYRVSKSKHAQTVILKGALLLKTIGLPSARPTMDIDLLRKGRADQASLVAIVKDWSTLEVQADGLTFLPDTVIAEEITKESEYKGTRILLDARMDNVRLRIQIDFGVGDVVVPGPRIIEYPVFLGGDKIELLAYPVESAIAEKLQAMVALGETNTRMKDFYDIWLCIGHLDFDTAILVDAIGATFRNRQTPVVPEEFDALTRRVVARQATQWTAFARKMGERELAGSFDKVVEAVRGFAMPLLCFLARGEPAPPRWKAGRGW
jgi:predicted nucleotidyltransferase component of viral defense system